MSINCSQLSLRAALIGCLVTGCTATLPASDPNAPVPSWTLQQLGSNAVQTFGPSSPPMPVALGQKYNIAFQADNPGGIKQITLDGSGIFMCESADSSQVMPNIPVSLQHQQADLTPGPQNQVDTHQSLLLVSFDYSRIPCGTYGSPPSQFFVTNGTLTLKGTASNYYGKTSSGQLQLTR